MTFSEMYKTDKKMIVYKKINKKYGKTFFQMSFEKKF